MISKNSSHFSFFSRILALLLSSFPIVLFHVTHVYQYLQMVHPKLTPFTPLSPSSPVFLSPQFLLTPVSTSPSLSPLSCVSKTPTGVKCQPATPESWVEKVTWHLTNQLYRGNSSTNLYPSHSKTHLSRDSQSYTVTVHHIQHLHTHTLILFMFTGSLFN